MSSMKSIYIPAHVVDGTLRSSPKQGKHSLEPLASLAKRHGLPFSILEESDVLNDAEVHKTEGDLWQCLDGEVTFICGGELLSPKFRKNPDGWNNKNELFSKKIKGGSTFVLKKGDWLWIPVGEPHQHSARGTARLIIIKIPKSF